MGGDNTGNGTRGGAHYRVEMERFSATIQDTSPVQSGRGGGGA